MNISTLILLIILTFVGLSSLAYIGESKACDTKAQSFEDHRFHFFGGCMVKHNDRWIPLDNIRGEDLH